MNWYFASGDLDFFWKEQLQVLSWLPQVFRPDQGFGTSSLLSLWLDYPFRLFLKLLSTVGLSWFIIEKILWLSVICLTVYSSYRLGKYVLGKGWWTLLTSIIYTANTYFLLLFAGGQLGVALAYGFAPFVLYKYIETADTYKRFEFRRAIMIGLLLAFLIVFDLRIAYLIAGAVVLYLLLQRKLTFFLSFCASIIVAGTLHLFWILPSILTGTRPATLGQDFTSPAMLKFFSFADFSHTLALLHPNWPENLFGKVYFLQPEFLVLPILAFGGLLFMKADAAGKRKLGFFALLGLIGVFMAKGVTDPAGSVFQWMFIYVPGFVMFRDPTKFYMFTAIAYAILIPFTLRELGRRVARHFWIVPTVFIVFWIFTIRALFLGQVSGNFKPLSLPAEHIQLKDLMVADTIPSRTLWIPGKEKFAFSSDIHPILASENIFPQASVSAVISLTKDPAFIKTLNEAGVKYVIVPVDLEQKLFLNNYHFDPVQRNNLINALTKTTLTRINEFHSIAVFRNNTYIMHSSKPSVTVRQQFLANTGLGLSIVFLVIFIICMKLSR